MTIDPALGHVTSPAEAVLARLRHREPPAFALGGFGPLIAAAILLVLTMIFAPSVAPERIVERPAGSGGTPIAEVGP